MGLGKIRNDSHAQYCKARQLNYLVQSEDFGLAYEQATQQRREFLFCCVLEKDLPRVRYFIREELAKLTPFHQMSIIRLRDMAKRFRVPEYHRLRKDELVREIQNEVDRVKKDTSGVPDQPKEERATVNSR